MVFVGLIKTFCHSFCSRQINVFVMGAGGSSNNLENAQDDLLIYKLEATHRPESLETLCKMTRFSRKEVQLLYRSFKERCPTGVIDTRSFKESFLHWFPDAVNADYAVFVFNTFDRNHDGYINFQEFLVGLSALMRGSTREKLRWIFQLYDIRHDNVLTKDEIFKIVISVHQMSGSNAWPDFNDHCQKLATQIFDVCQKAFHYILYKAEILALGCKEKWQRYLGKFLHNM